MKKWVLLLFFFVLSLAFPRLASAQSDAEQFHTKLHTTVNVNEGGIATITHQYTITNKTPTTYISQYGLKLSSSELKNIRVTSNSQQLSPEIVTLPANQQGGPGQTSIGITFPDKQVGEGKQRVFTISYTHPDAAVVSGSVLEITLPAQAKPEDYDEYTVSLSTPVRFGPPIRTTPTNFAYVTEGNSIITTFTNGSEGIFALFGSTQLFNLKLTYYLENTTNNVGIAQIALPPDTLYQQLYYHQLDPSPQNMESDEDGNWIATYRLPAGSQTTVTAAATAKLTLEPNREVPTSTPQPSHLEPQQFWPVNHSTIKDLAEQYSTAEAINDYVVSTLQYNTQRALADPTRMGALEVLTNPDQAVCTEFTDAYVTMARAAHIPSRRITGYAYTQNSSLRPLSLIDDILHAWPEYYDANKNQWVPIDPTWENTTGGVDYFHQVDLNHIVFAINGINSETPYPAGSYKISEEQEKTVDVTFGTSFPQVPFEVEHTLKPKKIIGLTIPGRYELNIHNTTGKAWYNTSLQLNTQNSQVLNTDELVSVSTILPFQTITLPIQFEPKKGFLPISDTIAVSIHDSAQNFTITSGPAIGGFLRQPIFLIGVAIFCIVATLGAGSVLVLRRKRQRSVRR
jgi:transglutaminase-like putative cysteine protease